MKTAARYGQIIRAISRALERDYAPERIVLFGSYAAGKRKTDSDIDLLIVKKTSQPFYRRLTVVRKIVSPMRAGMPFDPIVITPRELKQRLARGDQFLQEIVTHGTLVYGTR